MLLALLSFSSDAHAAIPSQGTADPMLEPFADLEAALDSLDAYLRLQVPDLTPVLLTHPPSARDARREYLETMLDSLGPQLEMIQRLHTRVTNARNAILRRRSMCRMAQHPISSLPPEVLQIIFSHAHSLDGYDASVAHTLSNVCVDWRQAAHAYRPIWRSITMKGPRDIRRLELSLKLSAQEDFHLTVVNDEPDADGHQSPLEDALRERLSSLVWQSSASISHFFRRVLNKEDDGWPVLANLRELRISPRLYGSFDGPRDEYFLDFQELETPKLEQRYLSDIHLIHYSITSHIKRIQLIRMSLSFDDLDTMLQTSPELEELMLHKVTGDFTLPSRFQDAFEIPTATLQNFVMVGVNETIARATLGCFRFPNLRSLNVSNVKDHQYNLSAGTPWYHGSQMNLAIPDLDRSTLPNAVYGTVGTFLFQNISPINSELPL